MQIVKRGFKRFGEIWKRLCKGIYAGICDAIFWLKTFKEHPLRSFSVTCAYMTCVTAVISFIVLFIIFVSGGGYPAQIEAIKTFGIGSIESSFTSGTVPVMYQPVVGGIMLFFLSLSVVFMLVEYFVSSSVIKKIIMAVDLLLLTVFSTAFTVLAMRMGSLGFKGSEDFALWLAGVMDLLHIKSVEQILLILLAAVAVTVVILMVLADKKVLGRILILSILSFGILPLMLLLIENLLAFAYLIIFCICFCFMLMLIGSMLLSEMGESGTAADAAPAGGVQKPTGKQKKTGADKIRVIEIAANQKIYIAEGNGMGSPLTQCVFTDTEFINHKFLCTAADFKSGKVKIMRGGKEISVFAARQA